MPKFVADLDMEKHQLLNAAIHNAATAPATPVEGQMWFDTTNHLLKVWDGSAWIAAVYTDALARNAVCQAGSDAIDANDYIPFIDHYTGLLKQQDVPNFVGSAPFTEAAQDSVGAMIADTSTIDLTYTDATPELKADVKDASITLAKMANLAQSTIIGRVTASTGVPEALSAANVRTIINVADGATANSKASGAELDTGTDDAKFATAKALADSGYVTEAGTSTLTNKRITPRSGNTATTATLTFDSDAYDIYCLTAQAGALSLANPSGTPTNGQSIIIRIKDDGTARAIAWDGSYWRAIGVTLPTTTVLSKVLYIGAIWNATETKWDVLAIGQQA
jgi:hypothetical protein